MASKKADKTPQRPIKQKASQPRSQSSNWLNFFRFGESYSSLLLGIVVVIVTTIILVFLVKDHNVNGKNGMSQDISSTQTSVAPQTPTPEITTIAENMVSPSVTQAPQAPTMTPKPTATVMPTKIPTVTQKPTLTVQVTKVITATLVPTKAPVITKVPEKNPTAVSNNNAKTHTVKAGESLWTIAEQYYKSGYNWVDIAQVNKLSDPSLITTGMKLTIPNVTPKMATVTTQDSSMTAFGPKITSTTYTVQKGDSLWGIAVRAYGDGYKWSEIAKINNISSPNVIYTGTVLKLPRTAPPKK